MNCTGYGLLCGTGGIFLIDRGRPQSTLFLQQRSITTPHFSPQISCGLALRLKPAYRSFASRLWEKGSSYRAINTLRLVYKNQSVKVV
jgi:hypothetical protein